MDINTAVGVLIEIVIATIGIVLPVKDLEVVLENVEITIADRFRHLGKDMVAMDAVVVLGSMLTQAFQLWKISAMVADQALLCRPTIRLLMLQSFWIL